MKAKRTLFTWFPLTAGSENTGAELSIIGNYRRRNLQKSKGTLLNPRPVCSQIRWKDPTKLNIRFLIMVNRKNNSQIDILRRRFVILTKSLRSYCGGRRKWIWLLARIYLFPDFNLNSTPPYISSPPRPLFCNTVVVRPFFGSMLSCPFLCGVGTLTTKYEVNNGPSGSDPEQGRHVWATDSTRPIFYCHVLLLVGGAVVFMRD